MSTYARPITGEGTRMYKAERMLRKSLQLFPLQSAWELKLISNFPNSHSIVNVKIIMMSHKHFPTTRERLNIIKVFRRLEAARLTQTSQLYSQFGNKLISDA
jgi:hypothetical protein